MPSPPDIHVVHVVPMLGPGGMELAMSRVISALRGGFRHTVVAIKGLADDRVGLNGTPVHCLHAGPRELLLAWRLRRLLRRLKPSVIHARNWGAWPDTAAARLMGLPRTPLIFSFHGLPAAGPMPRRRRIAFRMLAKATTCLFAVCHDARRMLVEDVGLPGQCVEVITNGVDTSAFSPLRRRRRRDRRLVLGSVGSLTAIKDHATLVAAAAAVARAGMDVELRLAGDGPLQEPCRQLAEKLGFRDRLVFCGRVSDVPAFLHKLDIFVLSSRSEGHPNALLEAMSCGLPCLATAVGGCVEVLENGRCGVLTSPGDPAEMASALVQLACDAKARGAYAKAARQRVCQEYDMRQMVRRYEDLYRRVARTEGPKRPEFLNP